MPTPSVLELISERIKTKSQPQKRQDPFKIGLVIEGGGMRGVISGGMVTGLQALSALPAIDAIYANSAGACAGAYFVADQSAIGTSIYYQNLTKNFISFLKLPFRGYIMDTDYLIKVMTGVKKLNTQKIISSQIPLHIYAACLEDLTFRDLYPYQDSEEVIRALSFAARIPAVCKAERYLGKTYVDGGVIFGGLTLPQAVEDDCTHILVLLTRPAASNLKNCKSHLRISLKNRFLQKLLKVRFPNTSLDKTFLRGILSYSQSIKQIYDLRENPDSNMKIEAIELPGDHEVGRLETRREVLLEGARSGYQAVMDTFLPYFEKYNLPVDESIKVLE